MWQPYQIENSARFCCVLLSRCPALKTIYLPTGKHHQREDRKTQEQMLYEIIMDLKSRGVNMKILYSSTLHASTPVVI